MAIMLVEKAVFENNQEAIEIFRKKRPPGVGNFSSELFKYFTN